MKVSDFFILSSVLKSLNFGLHNNLHVWGKVSITLRAHDFKTYASTTTTISKN